MAWIEFHGATIKRKQKFHAFRKELNWSVLEALGFLGSFWGEVIEVCESGDVTNWSPEYLASLTGLKDTIAQRVWDALLKNEWIDKTFDGRLLVHDWLDYAGKFLRGKYSSKNKQVLIGIWALHRRIYGDGECEPTSSRQVANINTTTPNLTVPTVPTNKSVVSRSFAPPLFEEVKAYCQERRNNVDSQNFVNFYESKGWMVGKTKMKDWRAAVRTWEARNKTGTVDNTPRQKPDPQCSKCYGSGTIYAQGSGKTALCRCTEKKIGAR